MLPTNWSDFFSCWKYYYQGLFFKKTDFARSWEALPKLICWKLWAARNKEIFEEKKQSRKSFSIGKDTLGGGSNHERNGQHQQGIIDNNGKGLGLQFRGDPPSTF